MTSWPKGLNRTCYLLSFIARMCFTFAAEKQLAGVGEWGFQWVLRGSRNLAPVPDSHLRWGLGMCGVGSSPFCGAMLCVYTRVVSHPVFLMAY